MLLTVLKVKFLYSLLGWDGVRLFLIFLTYPEAGYGISVAEALFTLVTRNYNCVKTTFLMFTLIYLLMLKRGSKKCWKYLNYSFVNLILQEQALKEE
ncbi:hypothetical protein NTH60_004703 [Enterobacter ludwigii]|nr:hypothetical protein [Enterobacter ludwigii]